MSASGKHACTRITSSSLLFNELYQGDVILKKIVNGNCGQVFEREI